jgi:septal ring factor EnvC (AmiA/AmiB activator)
MGALETQKQEKDRIMNDLKKQGKQLNTQLTAYSKQLKKVDNAINAAIKKALADATKAALKKAKDDEAKRIASEKAAANTNTGATTPSTKPATVTAKKPEPVKLPPSILLNADNIALNNSFEKNKGSLPWPVDKGVTIMHFGPNLLPSGSRIDVLGVTVAADIGSNVKSVFAGTVSNIVFIEDMQVVIIQHGKYFSTYSNLSNVTVQRGQNVTTGQVIGKVASNLDGIGAIDFFINDERNNIDPERWLKK